jgi:glutamate--cysteine ligase
MLPFVFEAGFGFERYVDYALDVPMYFVYRDGRYIDVAGKSFRDFLDGRVPELKGVTPMMADWADHLTTIFPEVRLKSYLEVRGADGGTWRRICGLPALWAGLLYDQSALDAAWDLVKDWTEEERQAMRDARADAGLRDPFTTPMCGVGAPHAEIATQGLRARAHSIRRAAARRVSCGLCGSWSSATRRGRRAAAALSRQWQGDLCRCSRLIISLNLSRSSSPQTRADLDGGVRSPAR